MKLRLIATTSLLAALALTGCDSSSDPAPTASAPATATSAPTSVPTAAPTPGTLGPVARIGQSVTVSGTSSTAKLTGKVSADGVIEPSGVYLTVSLNGQRLRAQVPNGFTPVLLKRTLDAGQAGPAFVVVQDGGDSGQWSAYVIRGTKLVRAEAPQAPVFFGDGFTVRGGATISQRSWITDGAAYTQATPVDSKGKATGPVETYYWEITGPGEGGGSDTDVDPTLVPTRIGG